MKGLILSGGAGTRLRPITHTSAKQLVPIANKPILFYGIEDMAAAGIKEIGIIISPETGGDIRDAVGDGSQFGVEVTYISQDDPLGLAHCVLIAEDFLGQEDFVMYLGDNMLEQGLEEFVQGFEASRKSDNPATAQILLAKVEDPRSFGVADIDSQGRVVQLVEKPENPPSDLALVGVYLFDKTIIDAVKAIEPSPRGELEITDAIQWLVDQNMLVRHEVLVGWWIDTGKKDPLLECNRLVLDSLVTRIEGSVDSASHVDGRVVIEAGAEVVNSTVRGPAIIGANTRVVDSHIGPFSSVSNDCEIINTELDNSVILANSSIKDMTRLTDSLVGRHVDVQRAPERPRATRLMLGDHSRVELHD